MKIKFLLISMLLANMAVAQYAPAGDKIKTRWAEQVAPENALPEYPRPMMVRPVWKNLNGLWQYASTAKGEKAPQKYEGDILVPFCIESSLSGVRHHTGIARETKQPCCPRLGPNQQQLHPSWKASYKAKRNFLHFRDGHLADSLA